MFRYQLLSNVKPPLASRSNGAQYHLTSQIGGGLPHTCTNGQIACPGSASITTPACFHASEPIRFLHDNGCHTSSTMAARLVALVVFLDKRYTSSVTLRGLRRNTECAYRSSKALPYS
eukprot:751768-Prorocentrum_minimum.AAC.7